MNKKGFTLVELLAVIAILSLLVIIALPNIMAMFKEAKRNSFLTECKQVYRSAQNQWMSDSMFQTDAQEYSRCETCTGKSLKLSGREELSYYIKMNKSGKVVKFYATDDTYQYRYDGNDLKIEDITNAHEVSTIAEDDRVQISDDVAYPIQTTDKTYFTYYINGDEVTITSYADDGPKNVVIPSTIDGHPVTVIDTNAFSYKGLTSVVIPNTVKRIEGSDDLGAFAYNNLTSLTIPSSVEWIGCCAFTGNQIKRLVVPGSVKNIQENAFGSNGMEELTLNEGIEEIGIQAFYANNLTTVTIPASVKRLSPGQYILYSYYGAFHYNPLRSVTIKGKNSESDFEEYRDTSENKTPFSWATDVTCVKNNSSNVENGCITWGA